MHTTNLACASGDFQKSFKNLQKCVILKMRERSTISKNASVRCFSQSATPDYNNTNLKSIKNGLKFFFFSPKSRFLHF